MNEQTTFTEPAVTRPRNLAPLAAILESLPELHEEDDELPIRISKPKPLFTYDERTGTVTRGVSSDAYIGLEKERIAEAIAQARDAIMVFDDARRLVHANAACVAITGIAACDLIGRKATTVYADDDEFVLLAFEDAKIAPWEGTFHVESADGRRELMGSVSGVVDDHGRLEYFVAVLHDVTVQRELERKLQLVRKLEAIGQLAAGLAHEINTPAQYVQGNLTFLADAFRSLQTVLDAYDQLGREAEQPAQERISELKRELDFDYIRGEISHAIDDALDGIQKIARIVRATKEFSHPSGVGRTVTDVGMVLQSAATIARHEWKYVADLEIEHDDSIGGIRLFRGPFDQAILNLIINAAHAVKARGSKEQGKITLRTRAIEGAIEIEVRDTGVGIPATHLDRVFEPFFTTKDVGKGTGQGLTVVYDAIVEKHGGSVRIDSTEGEGTTFILTVPRETA